MYEAFSGREFGPPPEANDGAQSREDKDKKDKKKKLPEDGLPLAYGGQKQQARRPALEQFLRPQPAPDKHTSLSDLLATDTGSKDRTQPEQKQAAEATAEAADAATAPAKHEAAEAAEAEEAVSMPEAAQEVLEDITNQLSDADEALSAAAHDSPEAGAQTARAQFLERAIDELQPLAERSASAAGAAEQGAASPAAIEAAVQAAYRHTVEQVAPGQAAAEEQKVQEAMAAIEAAEAAAPAAGEAPEAAQTSPAEASAAGSASEDAASSSSYTSSAARGAAGAAFGARGAGGPPPQAGVFHAMAAPPPPPVFGARGYANAPQPVREVLVPVEQPRRPGEWIPPFIAGAVVMRLIDNRRLRRERKQHKAEMSNVLRKVDVMSARISQLGYEARQRGSQALRAEAAVPPAVPEAPARPAAPAPGARQEVGGPARAETLVAAPSAPERPAAAPVMPIYERRAAAAGVPEASAESPAMPAALPERQPEYRTPVVLWQAESRQQPRPAEVTAAAPAAPRAERPRPQPPVPVERMSQQQLMAAAAEITVDSVSLSSVFENHEVSERGLRRMVAEYYRGGDVQRILQQEKHIKELSYERDPRYRDRPMEAEQEPGGSAAPQQQAVPAAGAATALSVPPPPAAVPSITYDAAPAPLLLPPRPQPLLQRHRRTIQPALIIANAVAFVVLATLVAVLLVVYL